MSTICGLGEFTPVISLLTTKYFEVSNAHVKLFIMVRGTHWSVLHPPAAQTSGKDPIIRMWKIKVVI